MNGRVSVFRHEIISIVCCERLFFPIAPLILFMSFVP